MLQVSELTCARGRRTLFSSLAFGMQAGEVLQVVGGNGRGKSTLLRVLMGLYTDYQGNIDWHLDTPPLYLGHRIGVKAGLTVLENLAWQAVLRSDCPRRRPFDEVLAVLGLSACRQVRCAGLSEGQKKRVSLAPFFLFRHACWLLDEPFSGLDAEGQALLVNAMDDHVNGGGSVMLTSHQPVPFTAGVTTLELA